MAAVLFQQGENGDRHIVSYASAKFSPAEKKYHVNEQEALAAVWAIRKYRMALQDKPFTLYTDNRSLLWLKKHQDDRAKLTRWALMLQGYQFETVHVPGKENHLPDFLSRFPDTDVPAESQPLDDPHEHPTLNVLDNTPLFSAIQREQRESPVCIADRERLQRIHDHGPTTAKEQQVAEKYRVHDGYVWRVRPDRLTLYVPETYQLAVIKEYHDTPLAAHPGRDETLRAISQVYDWRGMQDDVAQYVRSCIVCATVKRGALQPLAPPRPRAPQGPWHTVSLDILGPFDRSGVDNVRYALILTDTFSKWVEIIPLQSTRTATIISSFSSVCSRFGWPAVVISDNAVQLRSRIWENFCEEKHLQMEWSPIYHHRANPVERRVQEVKKILRSVVAEHPEQWTAHLDDALFALRTRANAATGMSPSHLLFGRTLRRPGEWAIAPECHPPVRALETRIQDAVANAEEYRGKVFTNEPRAPRHFQVGERVLCRQPAEAAANFAPKWTGPHPIVQVLGDGVYLIDRNGSERPVHIDNIRPLPPARPQHLVPADIRDAPPRPPGPFRRQPPRVPTPASDSELADEEPAPRPEPDQTPLLEAALPSKERSAAIATSASTSADTTVQ